MAENIIFADWEWMDDDDDEEEEEDADDEDDTHTHTDDRMNMHMTMQRLLLRLVRLIVHVPVALQSKFPVVMVPCLGTAIM